MPMVTVPIGGMNALVAAATSRAGRGLTAVIILGNTSATPTRYPTIPAFVCPSLFLNRDELKQLVGASKRPLQEAWLKKHRIPYTVNLKGRVNVLRAYVEKAHGMAADVPKNNIEPNLDVFRR